MKDVDYTDFFRKNDSKWILDFTSNSQSIKKNNLNNHEKKMLCDIYCLYRKYGFKSKKAIEKSLLVVLNYRK
jgi:hypothetical protein